MTRGWRPSHTKQDGRDSRRTFPIVFTNTCRQEIYDQRQPYYCSNHQPLLCSPRRAFLIAAPSVWNSLNIHTRSAETFLTFKSRLKTELFTASYDTWLSSVITHRAPDSLAIGFRVLYKCILHYITDRAWFSHLVRHPARQADLLLQYWSPHRAVV